MWSWWFGCGGQSGENEKGGGDASDVCEEVSALPYDAATAPGGAVEVAEAYAGLDGSWSAVLRCLEQDDEAVVFALAVDAAPELVEYEGPGCDWSLRAETRFDLDARITEALSTSAGEGGPISMRGEAVELSWGLDGSLDSWVDADAWREGDSASEPTCTLLDVEKEE